MIFTHNDIVDWMSASPIIDKSSQNIAPSKSYTVANGVIKCFALGLLEDGM